MIDGEEGHVFHNIRSNDERECMVRCLRDGYILLWFGDGNER